MPDVFLSYSRDDQAIARRFAAAFERAGIDVWWDQWLRSGENYDQVTETALREAKAVVVLWSKKSVDSRWVRAEATTADRNGTLVPAMIESCNRPIMFELKHTADLSQWKGDENDPVWQSFLADVCRFLGKGESPPPGPVAKDRGSSRYNPMLLWLATAVLVVGGALWALTRKSTELVPAPTASVAAPITLAVLPFANLSSDPEQEYFSDGLTEEILNQLARIKALRVTGRTSSFSFKGKNEDLRVISQKLGVANLLEGSVRKDGTNLRITAQLISGGDGAHLWSQTYDRELSKVFAVQEEIAKDVAKALSITLDVGDLPRSLGGTTNVEAYDKYLRGKQLVLQDGRADFIQGAQQLREAVALDPAFTLAWMWLNTALGRQSERDPDDPEGLISEARAARARVLELAPQSWSAQQVRALELMLSRKWAAAETELHLETVVDVPTGSEVEYESTRALFLISVGRLREAMRLIERAQRLDPLSLGISTNLQAGLVSSGRVNEAQAEYERSKGLQGNHGRADHYAFLRLLSSGSASQAQLRAQLDVFLKSDPLPMALNATLRDLLDKPEAARAAIRGALNVPGNQHPTRQFIIAAYADAYGDGETAMLALQRSTRLSGNVPMLYFIWYPFKNGVRTDPRFKDMIRGLGLVDYWRSTGRWADWCKPVGADDFECH